MGADAELPSVRGWGGMSVPGREHLSEDLERLTERAVLSRGLGRAYGDSALPPPDCPEVATTVLGDRMLSFDEQTGELWAEAGLSLRALNWTFLSRGWFTPVTPGTQFVTLGGMVASDVHGKNHHVNGCFGQHVTGLRMRLADGRIVVCRPDDDDAHPELFWATVGGMGLTGHILEVGFRMERIASPWIEQQTTKITSIEEFVPALREAADEWPFTVGWIDCIVGGRRMGRGTLIAGRWASAELAGERAVPTAKKPLTVPFTFPNFTVNPLTARVFNALKYHAHLGKRRTGIVHPEKFFYPLDAVLHWYRLYGKRGFTQYQCVLPYEEDSAGGGRSEAGPARRFLEVLTKHGGASPLAVIKDCGPEGRGLLSFPRPGMSIALDIAITGKTQALIDALNEATLREGGRIYLTKDGFTRPDHFRAMEPRLEAFQAIRRRYDPQLRLRSAQSVRLLGDPTAPASASAPPPDVPGVAEALVVSNAS